MNGPTNPLSRQIHSEKYRADGESFEESVNRVSSALKDSDEHFHQLREILGDMRFLPGGRIQAAAGSGKNTTMYNCFVAPTISDSFVEGENSIMDVAKYAATTMRMGGGIGYDFSTLRPRGDVIKKLRSYSSGPIAFMDIFDAVCRTVASSGHRRGAQMGVLRVDHPDIFDFVLAKQNTNRLTGFNVSIAITDEFMQAVKDGNQFQLRFNDEVYRYVDARDLWEQIMRSTWDWAEPGVLFIDRIAEMNNLYYTEKIAATNPCVSGETLILTRDGWCCIESLEGHEIEVYNGENWSRTVPRKTQECAKVYEVEFSDGSVLQCTANHQFELADGSVKTLEELTPEDVLVDWQATVATGGDETNTPPLWDVPLKGYSVRTRVRWLKALLEKHAPALNFDYRPGDIPVYTIGKRRYCLEVMLLVQSLGARTYMKETYPGSRVFSVCFPWDQLQFLRQEMGLDIDPALELNRQYKLPSLRVVSKDNIAPFQPVYCYHEPVRGRGLFNGVMTKQCGEQPLPPNGACLLGSFNLTRYIRRGGGGGGSFEFDFEQFRKDIPPVIRAMDNVVDRTIYPLKEQQSEALSKRRMGIGVTGVANAIEALGFEYGSEGFCEMLASILEILRDEAYMASSKLAREKGSFPSFNSEKYLAGNFIKTLPQDVRESIRENGIRNSHLLSIAPTGTISLCADNVSSGIEPVFALEYQRTIQKFDGPVVVDVVDYGLKNFGVSGRTAAVVTVEEHLRVLLTTQKFVDSSVSKTCNVPSDCSWEDFKKIYFRAWEGGAKGCTTFRIGGKRFGVLAAQEEGTKAASCRIDPESGRRECE